MVLIALSIIVLVLCSRYKQEPITNSRTGITVTTIITAVISFFELISVVSLGVMIGIFGGDAFRQMLYDAIASGELDFEDFATANEAMDFAISVVNAIFVVSMIVCILIAAFGIFATVIGFKTMADKTLTAAATANTAARSQAYNMPGYNNCNTSFQNGYYNYSSPQQNYQTYAQSNTEAAAQPTSNVSQNSEWYCVCGNKNSAGQKFCSNCGAANPDNNQ